MLKISHKAEAASGRESIFATIFVRIPPPWFVDERCRDLKIVSSFEVLGFR